MARSDPTSCDMCRCAAVRPPLAPPHFCFNLVRAHRRFMPSDLPCSAPTSTEPLPHGQPTRQPPGQGVADPDTAISRIKLPVKSSQKRPAKRNGRVIGQLRYVRAGATARLLLNQPIGVKASFSMRSPVLVEFLPRPRQISLYTRPPRRWGSRPCAMR